MSDTAPIPKTEENGFYLQGGKRPDLGPKVTVVTHGGFVYHGRIVTNYEDGGVEIEHRNHDRRIIPKDRVKEVRVWKNQD